MASPSTSLLDYLGFGDLADRPIAPDVASSFGVSSFYLATDQTPAQLWHWNGSTWAQVNVSLLSLLGDVELASPADHDVLVRDAGSGKFKNQRPKYVVGAFTDGVLTNSQNLLYHRFPAGVTFPANFGAYLGLTSRAGGNANATASTVIDIAKAASASPNTFSGIGTITIAAGGVVPTFATSGGTAQAFAVGDVLRIRAPSSADATFAGFYCSLVGFET